MYHVQRSICRARACVITEREARGAPRWCGRCRDMCTLLTVFRWCWRINKDVLRSFVRTSDVCCNTINAFWLGLVTFEMSPLAFLTTLPRLLMASARHPHAIRISTNFDNYYRQDSESASGEEIVVSPVTMMTTTQPCWRKDRSRRGLRESDWRQVMNATKRPQRV